MFSLRDAACLTMFSTLTAIAPSLPAAELPTSCERPQILLGRDQVRQSEGRIGETHCYQLDLNTSSVLQLEVSTSATDAWRRGAGRSQARIDVVDVSQRQVLGRTANELLVLAEAGATYVTIRAEDPRHPLPAYRLASRFAETTKSETDDEIEIEPEKSETDDEIEIEPEKSETDDEIEIEPEKVIGIASPFVCGPTTKSETDDEIEIEPEKSETDDEIEIEP